LESGCHFQEEVFQVADRADETSILIGVRDPEERKRFLAELFTRHRGRLRSMVRLRPNRRLQARVDPSDVLQETFLEASRRLEEYCREPPMPVFLWLRRLTAQKLHDALRFHLRSRKRGSGREVSLDQDLGPPSQTNILAEQLLGRDPSPSQAALKAEPRARLEEALDGMDAVDREVVALRHFERLSSVEAAAVLGIRPDAARKRYLRAIARLPDILLDFPGAGKGIGP
jgi:RNA polymerase sigma-70 factor (ECF subfamily)